MTEERIDTANFEVDLDIRKDGIKGLLANGYDRDRIMTIKTKGYIYILIIRVL